MLTDVKAILDKLMDESDREPVEIVNDRGEKARFNQIALLPATAESQKYVDVTVEHNFAVLQPLDENGEEIGNPLVADITIDGDGNCALCVVEKRELISEIMGEYRKVRGITPDDLADNNEENESGESGGESGEDEPEERSDSGGIPGKEEKPAGKGFFSHLFHKKNGQ